MSDLRILRHGWDEVEAFEAALLGKMTIQEKVSEYLQLFAEFHEWDPVVERAYQSEREEALAQIQDLRKMNYKHGKSTTSNHQSGAPRSLHAFTQ
jgi:hypothetical protein